MHGLTRRVPEGYAAVDLFPSAGPAPLRVCVLCRAEAGGAGGRLVVVRDVLDASVYLGCILDAAGEVDQWIEVWVQRVDALDASAGEGRGRLSNAALEERWKRTVAGLAAAEPDLLIRTGYEEKYPPAFGLDVARGVAARVMHEPTGTDWDVCRDEDVLAGRNLASYRSSLKRYLWVAREGAGSTFVPVEDEGAVRSSVLTGVNRDLTPFNLGGGLMMVRRLAPIAYADQVDIIGGRSWSGVQHGVAALDLRAGHESVTRVTGFAGDPEPIDPDRLFLGRHGRWGRLVEALHLKAKLLAEALNAVRTTVSKTGRPLLNLTDESFRVELWEAGVGLPRLWTSRVRIVDPGTAHEMAVGEVRERCFVSPDGIGRGVYRPEMASEGSRGRCDLRIRSVDDSDAAGVVVEATFRTDERVPSGGSELVELRVPLDDRRVLLHGRLRTEPALGPGEMRFRSMPVQMEAGGLKAAEGVPMRDVAFEVVPLASTPCDLHALGVLGVRTLLVDGKNTLAVALDELVSLARQAEKEREADGSVSLEDSFERAFFGDARWADSIGPQRLVAEEVPPVQALDMIPPEIWVRVLTVLSRMLMGVSDASWCRDVGDTRGLAPQVVFEEAASALADVLVRTRSLIVVDWRHNREVHAVVRAFREGMERTGDEGIPTLR
ncbi:MAG: hypothetical protein H6810_13005 [Phycisphaeraceae bacterium]|nr:MAG: hypothetical protein H6810_13005 [Phycisphaeraceae bacterium]